MTVEYKPKHEGTTHVDPEGEEFRVGDKGLLYRWLGGEWCNTGYYKGRLMTLKEFTERRGTKRFITEFRKYA
tara:strand:+ start:501 stop:716 length:216 start_codon:yes stop_codon:yes gene_type:complete